MVCRWWTVTGRPELLNASGLLHMVMSCYKQHNSITPSNISRRYTYSHTRMGFTMTLFTLHYTLLHNTVLYYTVLNYTILYNTALYYSLIHKWYDNRNQNTLVSLCHLCWATKKKCSSQTPAMTAPNNCWTTGRQIDRHTDRQADGWTERPSIRATKEGIVEYIENWMSIKR